MGSQFICNRPVPVPVGIESDFTIRSPVFQPVDWCGRSRNVEAQFGMLLVTGNCVFETESMTGIL